MRLTAQISEYEMDQVILDLGLDVNVLSKQIWECMGKPALQWYPIQLRMVNQQKILPMGRLHGITVRSVRICIEESVWSTCIKEILMRGTCLTDLF